MNTWDTFDAFTRSVEPWMVMLCEFHLQEKHLAPADEQPHEVEIEFYEPDTDANDVELVIHFYGASDEEHWHGEAWLRLEAETHGTWSDALRAAWRRWI